MTNKNPVIETATTEAARKIEEMKRGMAAAETLPRLRGVMRSFISDMRGEIYITTAFDLDTYRHNRKALAKDGWEAVRTGFVGDGDSRQTHIVKGEQKIIYCMDSHARGSTCTREQVGTEITPVYRVSCK